jgi:hypothetical protein
MRTTMSYPEEQTRHAFGQAVPPLVGSLIFSSFFFSSVSSAAAACIMTRKRGDEFCHPLLFLFASMDVVAAAAAPLRLGVLLLSFPFNLEGLLHWQLCAFLAASHYSVWHLGCS